MEVEDAQVRSSPTEKKALEDAVLAQASAIKRKRGVDEANDGDEGSRTIVAKRSHWSYVIAEAQWLGMDIRKERAWKRKMAFLLAHEIANTPVKLKAVAAGKGADGDVLTSKRTSRYRELDVAVEAKGRHAKRGSQSTKGGAAEAIDDIVALAHQRPLTYSGTWVKPLLKLVQRTMEERIIRNKLTVLRYDEEWTAVKTEYLTAVYEANAERAAVEKGRLAESTRNDNIPHFGGPRGMQKRREIGGAPGTQQYRRTMHPDQAQYMAQPWTADDDKLLCCLMTEFSENMGLVADVYISTRRSEGLYFEVATTMERIRNIAKDKQVCPVAKDQARQFLQISIPCSAKVVCRMQHAVQPAAEAVVGSATQEYKEATYKRAEFTMHSQPKADVQLMHINQALSRHNNQVPLPRTLIAEARDRRKLQGAQQQGLVRGSVGGGHPHAPQGGQGPPPGGGGPPGSGGGIQGGSEQQAGSALQGEAPAAQPAAQQQAAAAAFEQQAGARAAQATTSAGSTLGGRYQHGSASMLSGQPRSQSLVQPGSQAEPNGVAMEAGVGQLSMQARFGVPGQGTHAPAGLMPPQATAGLLQSQPVPATHGQNGSTPLSALQRRGSRGAQDASAAAAGMLPGNGAMGASLQRGVYGSVPAAHSGHQPP